MIGDSTFQTIARPIAKSSAKPASAYARLDVYGEIAPVLAAWADLEASVPCSIYQTRAWLCPWIETLGRKAAMQPMFVLASAADGAPVALLCLGLRQRGPLRIASFLGGKDANINLPLIRGGATWTPTMLRRLMAEAAQAMGRDAPDVFVLANQPFEWRGEANPLIALRHQASPTAAYATTLPRDAEQLFEAKLSNASLKKLRKKALRLAEVGPLTHCIAATASERAQILDAFLAQKIARFRQKGIRSEFDAPEMRAFIESASRPQGNGIELHALFAGDRIVATYGGASHGGQWSGMFNSFDPDERIAKSSPADLLLMRIMAKACADGLDRFDLGIGEARYKSALCDEIIPLFDAVVPVSLSGRFYAPYVGARQHAKRLVKASPRLMSLVNRLRVR